MPYKDPEMRRRKHREYCRKYNAKHREERNAASRAYHSAHREELHAKKRVYNLAHKSATRARNVAYYHSHKDEIKARVTKWREQNPKHVARYRQINLSRAKARKGVDCEFYAKRRAAVRMSYAKSRILRGLSYTPMFSRRIPDYAVMAPCIIDCRSPFIINNLTDSQNAYARELAIERRERSL